MGTTIHGRSGRVYLQGAGAQAELIGEAREVTIDIDHELDEDGALGDLWRTQLLGILSWSGSIEGNLDTSWSGAFEAATAETPRKWYWYPSSGSGYYCGLIWPKLHLEGGISGTARFSMDFDGDGPLEAK